MTEKTTRKSRLRRTPKPSTDVTRSLGPEQVQEFRRRMRFIGQLMRDTFGSEPGKDPASAARDAHRIVVSLIIGALVDATTKISTAELAALSKLLAEQRRLDISQLEIERKYPAKVSKGDTDSGNGSRPLPPDFGRIVGEIYGANLSEGGAAAKTGDP